MKTRNEKKKMNTAEKSNSSKLFNGFQKYVMLHKNQNLFKCQAKDLYNFGLKL